MDALSERYLDHKYRVDKEKEAAILCH